MHEHSIAYQKILKLRKAYLGLNVLSLFILGTIAEVFSHQYAFAIPMFIILFCVIAYISMFYFLAHQNCPWCKNLFFFKDTFGGDGISFLFRKKCIHCGKPHDSSSH